MKQSLITNTSHATWHIAGLLLLASGCNASASEEARMPPRLDAQDTQALASLQGRWSTPASGQSNIGYNSTDLGHVVRHQGSLRVLFGDACADDACTPLTELSDDVQGEISATDFPNGDAVSAFVAAHPAGADKPAWQAAAPPVVMRVNDTGMVAPVQVFRDGERLNMGVFKAPSAAFSDGGDGMFVLFERNELSQCSGGAAPSCVEGFACDTGLGACPGPTGELTLPCVIGASLCDCTALPGGGLCQDLSSPFNTGTQENRILSVAHRAEVGNADLDAPEFYYVKSWHTHKFINLAARTVDNFDPTRRDGAGDDYRAADGSGDTQREKVFLWGRPNFAGIHVSHQDAKLYFAYVDMPQHTHSGPSDWKPNYFTGLSNGTPQFSTVQADAAPLDLSGEDGSTVERFDIINSFTISYVPALQQWVMLYGGDLQGLSLVYWLSTGAGRAQRDPDGAIHIRFAGQPWGPWSAPQQLLRGGDPRVSPPLAGTQYGPHGVLFHPDCTTDCAPHEPMLPLERGFLYAANIIDPWITNRADGSADLYWNVSTWNPYGIVVMRTRIQP